jgi:3-isopropylmalate/(R)-2-methylmalate dehydratase small subunit
MSISWHSKGHAHVLGDNIAHDGGVIPFRFITSRITDPDEIIAHLFDEVDPTLKERLKPGDFIVAGKNFLCGKAHNNGLIGLKTLGIGILCESMPYRSFRAATGLALPMMIQCEGISHAVHDGDEIEVDFTTGEVANLTTGDRHTYKPMAPDVRAMVEQGGMRGVLAKFLEGHPELAVPLSARQAAA